MSRVSISASPEPPEAGQGFRAILQQPPDLCMNLRIGRLASLTALIFGAACADLSGMPLADHGGPTAAKPSSTSTTFPWFPETPTPSPEVRPTAAATADQKPGVGDLILSDEFSSEKLWNTATSDLASVSISGKALTIAVQPGLAPVTTFRQGSVYGNMYAEVTARPSLCRGADDYGLLFRAPNNVAYYRFAIACNGTAGAARISLGSPRVLQPPGPSADVPLGAPGEVRLGVWAVGGEFRFFLNDHYQFTATDQSYAAGGVGLFAHAAGDTPTIVVFQDLKVYQVVGPPAATATP
jgi:hypothetical protein